MRLRRVLAPQAIDLPAPRGRITWRCDLYESSQNAEHITDDADVDGHVFSELGDVDVDVDDLRLARERAGFSRDAIVEAAPDVQQHVTTLDGAVHVCPAVHADGPQAQRMRLWKRTAPVECRRYRHPRSFGERQELSLRSSVNDSLAGEDEWTRGGADEIRSSTDRRAVQRRRSRVDVPRQMIRDVPVGDDALALRVFGHVD